MSESDSKECTWLFGRGASIANGLTWDVPDEWYQEFSKGCITREELIQRITNELCSEMEKPSVHCKPFRKLLKIMAERTATHNHHRLMTTNWDYLLQREVNAWIREHDSGYVPRFLGANSWVHHFNGSVGSGSSERRSPFMLPVDDAKQRRRTQEVRQGIRLLLQSDLIVVVGISFECDPDKGLLGALRAYEDDEPIGAAEFIVIDPCVKSLGRTSGILAACFPRGRGLRVQKGFAEWIDEGMPELIGRIFEDDLHPAEDS